MIIGKMTTKERLEGVALLCALAVASHFEWANFYLLLLITVGFMYFHDKTVANRIALEKVSQQLALLEEESCKSGLN